MGSKWMYACTCIYIYRVTERQGHKMWNQSDIICQPPFVPIYSNSLKAL